jgi:hypothetical protein
MIGRKENEFLKNSRKLRRWIPIFLHLKKVIMTSLRNIPFQIGDENDQNENLVQLAKIHLKIEIQIVTCIQNKFFIHEMFNLQLCFCDS